RSGGRRRGSKYEHTRLLLQDVAGLLQPERFSAEAVPETGEERGTVPHGLFEQVRAIRNGWKRGLETPGRRPGAAEDTGYPRRAEEGEGAGLQPGAGVPVGGSAVRGF